MHIGRSHSTTRSRVRVAQPQEVCMIVRAMAACIAEVQGEQLGPPAAEVMRLREASII